MRGFILFIFFLFICFLIYFVKVSSLFLSIEMVGIYFYINKIHCKYEYE